MVVLPEIYSSLLEIYPRIGASALMQGLADGYFVLPETIQNYLSDQMRNIPGDISFLEVLDILNEQLVNENKEPIAFDHDCREGFCGMCSLNINGPLLFLIVSLIDCLLRGKSISSIQLLLLFATGLVAL